MASRNIPIKYTEIFINNKFVKSIDGKVFSVIDSANEQKICDVQEGDEADINLAVEAAKNAFRFGSPWRTMDASKRGSLMYKLVELASRDKDYLARLETLHNGKPLAESQADVEFSIGCLRHYAGWADKIHGSVIPSDGPHMTITRKEPVGVVGQIIPWNYPLLMTAWKWGPALATGCTIVMKPSVNTPLTTLHMAALSKEAGFPDGVINIVPGRGSTAGNALSKHMDVNKIAFTGSTAIGKKIMKVAAETNLKRVSLELGGKSPLIILPDADIDEAVSFSQDAIYVTMGQCCSAGSRTLVHESIYDEFVKKSVEAAKKRKIGDPFEKDVNHGPMVSEKQFKRVMSYIETGKKEGAKIETGGNRWGTKGYFIEPTIFTEVKDSMEIARDEIFGPVQLIFKFSSMEEAFERANRTYYGLAAGIVTKNIDSALMFAQKVQAGSVWVNCWNSQRPQTPFGGYKESGFGRDLGEEGLNNYLETKTITIRVPQKNS
ncbi:aldehyde dehydrogenase 1A1-like [Artemia franciscana]|uniref:Aldehyde dehydrogenase domain-containing protein n=1 Tax=Artemia franciscana TaxID=6661 RepID=A0AA88H8D9_ARTSF|nr:hypothetical protein QYM36_017619 [Artemia franciscana]